MNTIEVLKAARALIAEPQYWTRGALMRDADDQPLCDDRDGAPVCWCAIGALMQVVRRDSSALCRARMVLRTACPSEFGIADFNDSATHAEVLAAFDRAIVAAEVSP